ncbi:MAG: hypothetical protein LBO80_04740, partial [Treponema sp.]|nr:hypothetical protein [Treponema sp.]
MKNPGASSWVSSFCKVWIVCGVHTNTCLAHYNSITPLTLFGNRGKPLGMNPAGESKYRINGIEPSGPPVVSGKDKSGSR